MRRHLATALTAGAAACAVAGCASAAPGGRQGGSAGTSFSVVISRVGTEPAPSPYTSPTVPKVPKIDTGSVPPEAARFAWADGNNLPPAFTITALRGISPQAALRILAPRPQIGVHGVARTRALIDGHNERLNPDDYTNYVEMIAATTRDGWTLVLEDNGFAASQLPTAARLSRAGTANVLYRSVDADYSYVFATNGRVVRAFDPLLNSSVSGQPLPAERALRFSAGKHLYWTNALSFELTRRLTGFVAQPSDFDFDSYRFAVGVAP